MRFFLSLLSIIILASCSPKLSSGARLMGDLLNGIMGGKDLKEGDELTSHIVGVWDQQNEFLCTGSIIEKNIILTAAHCVVSPPSQLKVIFGIDAYTTLTAREVDIQKEYVRRVVAARVHEKYDPESSSVDQNDIAVLKFAGEFPPNYRPVPILKSKEKIAIGQEAVVAGFGVNQVDMAPIDVKKYGAKKLREALDDGSVNCSENLKDCFEMNMTGDGYLRSARAKIKAITQSEVRLDESKGQGTCSGDSGGPAFVEEKGQYFLWGITSRGNVMCDFEGVYTNALEHMNWIEKTIQSF